MSGKNLKVSVLMSVYNGEKFLSEAVESILNQTFRNFEFLIIDDGSTDTSFQILSTYAAQDERVRIVRNDENVGLTRSLNKGLELSNGEYIARMDSDDISLPERLSSQVDFLDKRQEIAVVGSGIQIIDENSTVVGSRFPKNDNTFLKRNLILKNSAFAHSSVMFRKDVVMKTGGYDNDFRYAQDYELWSRISENHSIGTIEKPLIQWRAIPDNISASKRTEQLECILQVSKLNINKAFPEVEVDLSAYENIFLSVHGIVERYVEGDLDRLATLWTALLPIGKDLKEFGRGLSQCGYSLVSRGYLSDGRKMTQIAGEVFGIKVSRIRFIKSLLKYYLKKAN